MILLMFTFLRVKWKCLDLKSHHPVLQDRIVQHAYPQNRGYFHVSMNHHGKVLFEWRWLQLVIPYLLEQIAHLCVWIENKNSWVPRRIIKKILMCIFFYKNTNWVAFAPFYCEWDVTFQSLYPQEFSLESIMLRAKRNARVYE
jgi:hypothetical protein